MTSRHLRPAASLVLLWVAAWLVVQMVAAWPFDTDDAFITLRYARHLAEGYGITWNPGEPPVEGYSNFTHVLLGAAALKSGADPLLALKVLNASCLLGTLAVVHALARTFAGPLLATLPVVVLSVFPGEALWAVSGLETALYQLLVAGATLALVRGMGFGAVEGDAGEVRPPRPPALRPALVGVSSALVLLASLTRPEGPVVGVVLGLALLVRVVGGVRCGWLSAERAVRAVALFALAFAGPYAVYFAWRLLRFGQLVPNTVLCKAAWAGDPWELLRDFWSQAWWVVLAALAIPRRLDARHVALWGVPLAYALILYGADPIIGTDARHFLAALALLAVAVGASAAGWARLVRGPQRRRLEAAVVLVAVALATPSYAETAVDLAGRAERYARRMETRRRLAAHLEATLPADATYLIGDTGLVPYETPQRVIDAFCLNSAEATRPDTRGSSARWVTGALAEEPDAIVVHSSHPQALIPRPEYGFYPELLRREELKSSYRLDRIFGDETDDFHYWVLRRVDEKAEAEGRD